MMDLKEHWENIYRKKSISEVSWFSDHLYLTLELIPQLNLELNSPIIDIGGGASTLADDLLNMGFTNLTVLDISEEALKISKERLQDRAEKIKWICEDILSVQLNNKYNLWHDRAVFHFLREDTDRLKYKQKLDKYLSSNGFTIFSGFADDGPDKCSGLQVRQHNEQDFKDFFGTGYQDVLFERTSHFTPAGIEQKFITALLKKL